MKIINTLFAFLFLIALTSGLAGAALLSDQGTDVRDKSTGVALVSGNLTILIYTESSSGSLLYNQTFTNGIANGSWNVMISPNLEFGNIYWKDYSINGQDLDFDGNERVSFQSSVGLINNASYINFSLIGNCSSGSSIRQVYANGSVECEADDSGSGSSDLTNYALKNQSESFSGNVTASSGLFSWLGSLANRITKLFVQDIDASGNVNVSGNVTASYFKGDGSLLTGIQGSSYNASYDAKVSYNVSFNQSLTDILYASAGSFGGNSSWNQSFANSLYASKAYDYNQSDGSYNSSYAALNSTYGKYWYNMTIGNGDGSYNSTYAQFAYNQTYGGSTYNASYAANLANNTFNQTLTDNLYSSKIWNYNQSDGSYNSSYAAYAYNQTAGTYNSSYSIYAYNHTSLSNAYTDSIVSANSPAWATTYNSTYAANILNKSFNQTLTDLIYASINYNYNQSDGSYNATYAANVINASFNQSLTDLIYASIVYNYNQSGPIIIDVNGRFWNKTYAYNASQVDALLNRSFNQTLTDTLYASIVYSYNQTISANVSIYNSYNSIWTATYNSTYAQYSYNQTTAANSYTDSVNATQTSWISATFLKIADALTQYFNKTDITARYYNKTDIDGFGYVNSTGLNSYNDSLYVNQVITGNNSAWISTYNSSYDSKVSYNVSFNQSLTDLLYASIGISGGNSSWNQSFANSLYSGIQWGYNHTSLSNSYTDNIVSANSPAWTATYNSSYAANLNNASWNQTLTDSLYSSKVYNYNQSDGSYNSSYAQFAYNQTYSGSTYNSSYAQYSYNQSDGSYNSTYSSFNSTYGKYWYNMTIGNGDGSYNSSYAAYAYNQTYGGSTYNSSYAIYSYNQSDGSYNSSYAIFAYNGTSAGLVILNKTQCPAGNYSYGMQVNGTWLCRSDSSGAASVETDPIWAGNLTSGVSADLNPLTNIIQSLGASTKRWLKGWFQDIDVSRNVTVAGNVSAAFYTGSLNYSTFPTSACSGTDKATGIDANGNVICGSDQTSGGGSGTSFTLFNRTTADVSTTGTTTYSNVLTLPLTSGATIEIECMLMQDAAATTTGIQLNSTLTGTSSVRQVMEYYSSATAQAICQGTSASLLCSPTASSGITVTPNRIYIHAVTSSAGILSVGIRSEVSGSAAIARAGSWCRSIEG